MSEEDLEERKGLEKYIVMIKSSLAHTEKLIQTEINNPRRDILLEKKSRLEYELKTAILGNKIYKILQKIVKNDEEYDKLLKKKDSGEFVDDFIDQNRYQAKLLADQDKKLCEEQRKETEAEKKRRGVENIDRPVLSAIASFSSESNKHLHDVKSFISYDENYVTKHHQKIAQKSIDCIINGFQLEKPPNHIIKGLNPSEEVVKLEYQKLKKDEKEIKNIDKQIKFIQNYSNNFVKVIFKFKSKLKKLIYSSDILTTEKYILPRHIWCGILDFPISNSVIFGRVSKKKRFKGGNYYFSLFKTLKYEIIDRLERLEDKVPNLFPYDIIESDRFTGLMSYYKFATETRQDIRQDINEELDPFIRSLNHKKELIDVMKKIPHFGTIQYAATKFISDTDVSTICIPYKEVTYFHIDQFGYPPKKYGKAFYSLLNVFEELSI